MCNLLNNDFNIIKISDLKLFTWANLFLFQTSSIQKYRSSPLIPVRKDKPYRWWFYYYRFFEDLGIFSFIVGLVASDFIVHINYKVYKVKQDDYIDSEALLLACLKALYFIWISLLPILTEVFQQLNPQDGLFTDVFAFYEVWSQILPVMDELIFILHKLESKFIFEQLNSEFHLDYWPLYFDFMLPRLSLDQALFNINQDNAQEHFKFFIKNTFFNKFTKEFVFRNPFYFDGVSLDLYEKEQPNSLSKVLYINQVICELTLNISYETIHFIFFNNLVDYKSLRIKIKKHIKKD